MACAAGAGTFDSSGPLSVASAIGVLAAIITVHECGHFVAARSRNIHVTQFSIGFGPQIWSYKVPLPANHSIHTPKQSVLIALSFEMVGTWLGRLGQFLSVAMIGALHAASRDVLFHQ